MKILVVISCIFAVSHPISYSGMRYGYSGMGYGNSGMRYSYSGMRKKYFLVFLETDDKAILGLLTLEVIKNSVLNIFL